MNNARFKSVYSGLTSLAKKVYDLVPIADSWSARQVMQEIERRDTPITREYRAIEGCLNTLVNSGLVLEHPRGSFRRVEINTPTPKEPKVAADNRPVLSVSKAPPPAPEKPKSALDRLLEVATKLETHGKQTLALGKELEDAVLDAQAESEAMADQYDKFKQVALLLKNL